jgi:hypothetical protein
MNSNNKEINPILFVGNPQWLSYYYNKYKEKEKFNNSLPPEQSGTKSFLAFIMIIILLSVALWIGTLVRLIIRSNEMPVWAIILAILFLILPIPGGVLLAFALTFISK